MHSVALSYVCLFRAVLERSGDLMIIQLDTTTNQEVEMNFSAQRLWFSGRSFIADPLGGWFNPAKPVESVSADFTPPRSNCQFQKSFGYASPS
jgi:hypothetical protein